MVHESVNGNDSELQFGNFIIINYYCYGGLKSNIHLLTFKTGRDAQFWKNIKRKYIIYVKILKVKI